MTACEFFLHKLDKIYNQNSIAKDKDSKVKVKDKLTDKLWYHEPNIWECIYRAIEQRKKMIQKAKMNKIESLRDLEDESSDEDDVLKRD